MNSFIYQKQFLKMICWDLSGIWDFTAEKLEQRGLRSGKSQSRVMNPGFECKPLTPGSAHSVSCNSQTSWGGSKGGSLKGLSILFPGTCDCGLIWKRGICRWTYDLQMRAYWIISQNFNPADRRHTEERSR